MLVPAGIVALALVARIVVVAVSPEYRPVFDALDYDRHAVSIASGHGYPETIYAVGGPTAFRPPLFPYLLGAVYELTGARWDAGRLTEAVLGAAVVALMFLVADRLWGRRVALVTAGVAAVYPPLLLMNAGLLTEPVFVALALGMLLAVLAARRSESRALLFAAAAGVLCGLAALTRSNGILLALPAAIGVWTLRPRLSLRALATPAVVLAATALTIAPWTIRNAVTFGTLVPISTQTGPALAGTYNHQSAALGSPYKATWVLPENTRDYGPLFARRPGYDEADLDRALRGRSLDFAVHHPGYVAEATWLNGLRMFELYESSPFLENADRRQQGLGKTAFATVRWSFWIGALLALVGVVFLLQRPNRRRGPAFIWLVPVLTLAGVVTILGIPRYRSPVYPFIVFLAAIALVDSYDRLRGRATILRR